MWCKCFSVALAVRNRRVLDRTHDASSPRNPRSSREHATDVALPLRSDICASVSFFDVLRGGLDFVLSRLCVCVCRDPLMSVRVRVRSFQE